MRWKAEWTQVASGGCGGQEYMKWLRLIRELYFLLFVIELQE